MIEKRFEKLLPLWFFFLISLAYLAAGSYFLHVRHQAFRAEAEQYALRNAASIAASLQGQNLERLLFSGIPKDDAELARLRERLGRSIEVNPLFRYASVYIVRQGEVFLVVDSEPEGSEYHVQNFFHYAEADPFFVQVLEEGIPRMTEAVRRDDGNWLILLIPMGAADGSEMIGGLSIVLSEKELYESPRANSWRLFWILLLSWVFVQVSLLLHRSYRKGLLSQAVLEQTNHELQEMSEDLSLLVSQMPQALGLHEIICDEKGRPVDYRFLRVNPKFTEMTGLDEQYIQGKTLLEVLPDIESFWIEAYGQVALTRKPMNIERYSMHFDRWFDVHVYSPKPMQFITIFEDITEKREREHEIEYLTFHDRYTGMYNRKAFELNFAEYDSRRMLPLCMVLFDINALRVVNETYGNEIGDLLIWQLGDSIKEVCTDASWISARLDGDAFGLLIPYHRKDQTELVINQVLASYQRRNMGNQYGTISWGLASKEEQGLGFDALLRMAEDDLFEHKIFENTSTREQTIDVLLQSLFSKCAREKEHSSRVSHISVRIAKQMGLVPEAVDTIRLAGVMHDIGKVAIDDTVLNKPGKLDEAEWQQMRRHPEIGFHLLSSVSRYSSFAKDVLAHHEKWDGTGYPRGLKGELIPLSARIIAVADAFDAMLCERPYHKPMTLEEAKQELLRCSATQFDPEVVSAFLEGFAEERA